jgi:hypothetical protein
LTFSSSPELEESSLEKLKLMRAAHARDMVFWNFFFFLSPKRCFIALVVVVPLDVVVLVVGVELLPLGAVDDEVGGVVAFDAAPR